MDKSFWQKAREKASWQLILGWWRVRPVIGRAAEILRYSTRFSGTPQRFHIVTCERNAGEYLVKCLDSVYEQEYDRRLVRQIVIDDASTDGTDRRIEEWLATHPDHSVEYHRNLVRLGGCLNTMRGFRMARPGTIAIELNGDDWLPDSNVLPFINRVYHDGNIWMTYNTARFTDHRRRPFSHPIPREAIAQNSFRKTHWYTGCLHSFRSELFSHLREVSMIDPETGDYWQNADDAAFYLSLLELSGAHSRHLDRITYIQNVRDYSEVKTDPKGQRDRTRRIREMTPYSPLPNLTIGEAQTLGLTWKEAGAVAHE
ncbi:glycosyltransferase family 2 protein [bacterium]|nr:glycosyltransferase family 2 protein [bacterium]